MVGIAGALFYAQRQNIPAKVVAAMLPALLLELSMYVATGFAGVRARLSALGPRLPAVLLASAIATYAILTVPLGSFRWQSLLLTAALVAALVYWYRVLPPGLATDLGFLSFTAAVILSKILATLYINPLGKPDGDIVGRLMWWRLGILAALLIRGAPQVDFGFFPRQRDWIVGLRFCLYSLVLLIPLALGLGLVRQPVDSFSTRTLLTALGTFAGALWFTALGEELFFRGLLQEWLSGATRSSLAGLSIASILYGATHLWFSPGFPNYRHALITVVLGVFCGLAYSRAGFRSAMVTHALVVAVWRVAFLR